MSGSRPLKAARSLACGGDGGDSRAKPRSIRSTCRCTPSTSSNISNDVRNLDSVLTIISRHNVSPRKEVPGAFR